MQLNKIWVNSANYLEKHRNRYAPILAVTDPAIVGGHAGSMLMVTRFGQNGIKEIDYARQRFEQNGIDVKGVVFNGVLKKASNAYGYYGYSNYEYKSDK